MPQIYVFGIRGFGLGCMQREPTHWIERVIRMLEFQLSEVERVQYKDVLWIFFYISLRFPCLQIAQTEQTTFTELVNDLTGDLMSDLAKAR